MSRECSLDAVAARNILKVALASKVMMEVEDSLRQQQQQQQQKSNQKRQKEGAVDDEEEDPFALLFDLDDVEASTHMHGIPTASVSSAKKLDRIVQCAQDGNQCNVMEITDLIEELERLNLECEGKISRQCSLDAVTARNILKVALASQATVMAQHMVGH
jgi:hypothetical protein